MSLDLEQLATQLRNLRGPIVDNRGRMTSELKQILYLVTQESNDVVATAQTAAETAQTAADSAQTSATAASTAAANAAQSSGFIEYPNGKATKWANVGSGYPAGNPTRDLTATCKDKEGTQVATMTVRGSLASATGLITLSVQSESASTGYTIDETLVDSGTSSARANITVTFPDSSVVTGVLSWASQDQSAAFEDLLFA